MWESSEKNFGSKLFCTEIFDFFLRMRKQKTKFFVKTPWNLLRARFALCHTYSFLPDRSESKTCQEQVSHRLSKMNLCPPAPCWGLRTPPPFCPLRGHPFGLLPPAKPAPGSFRYGVSPAGGIFQSRAVRFHLTVLQKKLQRFSSKWWWHGWKFRAIFFCFPNLQVSRISDRRACGWSCLYWKRKITLVKC